MQWPQVPKTHVGRVVSQAEDALPFMTWAPESHRASSVTALQGSYKDLLGFEGEGAGQAASIPSGGNGRF